MKVKHLDHLNLTVRDLQDTIDFYGRVFGFEVVERGLWNGHDWAILRSGDAMLCAYEHPELSADGREDHHHVSHFGLRITDREAWEKTLAREGLPLLYGGVRAWPHSTAWYVADPTGYEIEVALWHGDTVAFDAAA